LKLLDSTQNIKTRNQVKEIKFKTIDLMNYDESVKKNSENND
jgi:hypothetical protein